MRNDDSLTPYFSYGCWYFFIWFFVVGCSIEHTHSDRNHKPVNIFLKFFIPVDQSNFFKDCADVVNPIQTIDMR